jgi:hypothetical protein
MRRTAGRISFDPVSRLDHGSQEVPVGLIALFLKMGCEKRLSLIASEQGLTDHQRGFRAAESVDPVPSPLMPVRALSRQMGLKLGVHALYEIAKIVGTVVA